MSYADAMEAASRFPVATPEQKAQAHALYAAAREASKAPRIPWQGPIDYAALERKFWEVVKAHTDPVVVGYVRAMHSDT